MKCLRSQCCQPAGEEGEQCAQVFLCFDRPQRPAFPPLSTQQLRKLAEDAPQPLDPTQQPHLLQQLLLLDVKCQTAPQQLGPQL